LVGNDFNNDGFDDLAVGAYHENVGTVQDAGAVNVLYGSSSGLQATSPDDQFWIEDTTGVNNDDGSEADDNLGREMAAGDFNGDTDDYDDLAIGIPGEDVSTPVDAGAVLVLYGSTSGLQATSPDDQFGTQDSANVEDQSETGDEFAKGLRAGDFDLDGNDDLAIGAWKEDLNSIYVTAGGSVNVLYGSSTGLQATSPVDQFWSQDVPIDLIDDAENGDRFGFAAG
jgi:hypothetical protein